MGFGDNLGFVVLTNLGGTPLLSMTAGYILDMALGLDPVWEKLSLEELRGATVTVTLKGNALFMERQGQAAVELVPYKGTEFTIKGREGSSVKFVVEGGVVTEIVMGGRFGSVRGKGSSSPWLRPGAFLVAAALACIYNSLRTANSMNQQKLFLSPPFLLVLFLFSAFRAFGQEPRSLIARQTEVNVSRGGIAQSFEIASAILRETRRLLVVLPTSYAQSALDRRYPVTVVVDGEYLTPTVATVSDELTRHGQIPESVIVGIENVGGADFSASNNKRVYDLTPPGLSVSGSSLHQGGDLFLDFIERELLPAIDRKFRTSAPRIFVGVSSGGVLATYAAATRSTYSAVISLDAPIQLGDSWLAKKLIARAQASGRPVRYASLEANFGWPEPAWQALVAVAPASWKLYREKFELEGHETLQMLGAYLGLRQLFGDYSRFSVPKATAEVLPYYTKVSESLGARVLPPSLVIRDLVDDLLAEGNGSAARDAYEQLVFGYGSPTDNDKLLYRIAEVELHPPPGETVEALLATPFPTAEEARAFIGEWKGDISMRADAPRTGNTRLRITVVRGLVVGETIAQTPNGEIVQRWDYMKVTSQGMNWGRLNDKRPRGVMLFVGRLDGDTLYGQGQFAGIKLENPPPPLHFVFKRVSQ